MVVNSPHSGRFYPETFLKSSRLNDISIRWSEDYLVDELVSLLYHDLTSRVHGTLFVFTFTSAQDVHVQYQAKQILFALMNF